MTVTAQLADGRTLEFPDGTDPAVVQATVKKVIGAAQEKPTPFVPSGEKEVPSLTSPEGIAGNPLTRFALGAASPVLGAAQLMSRAHPAAIAQRAVGLPTGAEAIDQNLQQLQELKDKSRAETQGSTGIDLPELAGQVFSPAFLKWAQASPQGLSYVQRVLQGLGMGGAAGLTTPVTTPGDFGAQKAAQTAAGAAVGGAIPAAAPLVTVPVKAAYNALSPSVAKGRAYLGAAGDKVDEIIRLLRSPQELVPGSAPTAGEAAVAAGRPEFAALQKQAAQVTPTPYVARQDAQNAARIASLRTVGQNEAALKVAEAARSSATAPLYRAARESSEYVAAPDTVPVVAKINLILGKNPGNRELVTELNNILDGLEKAGGDPGKVASVIDGLKATLSKKENEFIKGTLTGIKNDLAKAIPGYEQAQAKFAAMSRPVNQMQIGQYLEKKLVPALSEEAKQKSGSFAASVADARGTIKRSTGEPRFAKLEQALTPEQMKVVQGIQDDLARGARFEDLAKAGATAAPDITGASAAPKLTGMLSRGVTVANAIIERLEGKVNKRVAAEIAAEMLNPPKVAESMQAALARANRNKAIARTIQPYLRGAQASAAISAARASQ